MMGLPAHRYDREIKGDQRIQDMVLQWVGGRRRGEESIRIIVVCYRLLQIQTGRGKCYHTGKMGHNWAEPP